MSTAEKLNNESSYILAKNPKNGRIWIIWCQNCEKNSELRLRPCSKLEQVAECSCGATTAEAFDDDDTIVYSKTFSLLNKSTAKDIVPLVVKNLKNDELDFDAIDAEFVERVIDFLPDTAQKKALSTLLEQKKKSESQMMTLGFVILIAIAGGVIWGGLKLWGWVNSPSPKFSTYEVVRASLNDPDSAEFSNYQLLKEMPNEEKTRFVTYVEVQASNVFGGRVRNGYCVMFDAIPNSTEFKYSPLYSLQECTPQSALAIADVMLGFKW